jgi:hypothetical protein
LFGRQQRSLSRIIIWLHFRTVPLAFPTSRWRIVEK